MWSTLVIVDEASDPVFDLTTLEAVQAALTEAQDEAEISDAITAQSKILADLLNARFALTTVIETFHLDRNGPCKVPLNLTQYPVREIQSVIEGNSALANTEYEHNSQNGQLWRVNGDWCGKAVVTYSGGYDLPDEAPAALAQWVIDQIVRGFAFAGADPTVRSIQHGDVSVTYTGPFSRVSVADLPPDVLRYRRLA